MKCTSRNCPDCGDRLIHQMKRGADESSSAFGQHVHDELPRTFFWLDVDGAIYKRAHKLLRLVEHKPMNGGPSRGQQSVLPLLAMAIKVLTLTRVLHGESGVFIIYSDPPFTSARVVRVGRNGPDRELEMAGELFRAFKSGDPLPRNLIQSARGAA